MGMQRMQIDCVKQAGKHISYVIRIYLRGKLNNTDSRSMQDSRYLSTPSTCGGPQ